MANERYTVSGTVTKGVTKDEAKRRLAALRETLAETKPAEPKR